MNTITTPNPILPVAPEIEEDVIELTISEVDRQTASEYVDNYNCLICTALRNRGINVHGVSDTRARLEGGNWNFEYDTGQPGFVEADMFATSAPFYLPSVVGKVIRLRKVR